MHACVKGPSTLTMKGFSLNEVPMHDFLPYWPTDPLFLYSYIFKH